VGPSEKWGGGLLREGKDRNDYKFDDGRHRGNERKEKTGAELHGKSNWERGRSRKEAKKSSEKGIVRFSRRQAKPREGKMDRKGEGTSGLVAWGEERWVQSRSVEETMVKFTEQKESRMKTLSFIRNVGKDCSSDKKGKVKRDSLNCSDRVDKRKSDAGSSGAGKKHQEQGEKKREQREKEKIPPNVDQKKRKEKIQDLGKNK